jgi:hypothetical protein
MIDAFYTAVMGMVGDGKRNHDRAEAKTASSVATAAGRYRAGRRLK